MSLGEDVYDAATAKKYESLLEKKWTSIVRLQKKVCGLCFPRNRLRDRYQARNELIMLAVR